MILRVNIIRKVLTKNTIIGFVGSLIILFLPFLFINKTSAVSCNSLADCSAKQAALEQDKAAYQAEISRLNNESKTLQSDLDKLAAEKSVIQSQIDIYQAQYDELTLKIAETEKQIADNKDALGKIIADLYVDDKVSPIEMIASSKNISEFIDKQEYRNSVRKELTSTIARVKELKISLSNQRTEVEKVLGDQKNAKQALVEKETEQQSVLSRTQGQEAEYQRLTAETDAALKAYAEEYKNLMRSPNPSVGISDPSKGNYPWGTNCYIDNNLLSWGGVNGDGTDPLGYACRQCTSYVAWKIFEHTGRGYAYWGNAKMWPNSAINSGVQVGYTARANSAGVNIGGYYGHVVWVETDPDSEGRIVISQYNSYYDNTGDNNGPGWGNYSKKLVYASDYDRFIYF